MSPTLNCLKAPLSLLTQYFFICATILFTPKNTWKRMKGNSKDGTVKVFKACPHSA